MINLLIAPTRKNPTYCFTFSMFQFMELGFDHKKRESLEEALAYIESTKHYVLTANVEYFRAYCEKEVFPPEGRLQECEDSIRIVHNLTIEIIQNKHRWKYLMEQVLDKSSFMRTLVKNAPDEHRPFLITMAATIVDFCKKELNESQEDQNKGENP